MCRASMVVAVLAACGGGGSGTPPDATPDVAIDASGPGPVTVQLTSPVAGIQVVFLDATDALLASLVTDPSDRVSANVPPGGSVNVITPFGSTQAVESFLEVIPGDVYVVDYGTFQGVTESVTVPARASATKYTLNIPCTIGASELTTSTTPMFATSFTACDAGTTRDFYVSASDATGVLGGFLERDVTIGPTITLSGTYLDPVDRTIALTGIPASVTSASLLGYLLDGTYHVGAAQLASGLTVTGGAASATFRDPPLAGVVAATFAVLQRTSYLTQFVSQRDTYPGNDTIDVAAAVGPWIQALAVDAAMMTASWTESDGGRPLDGVVVEADVARAGGKVLDRIVSGPPHAMTIRIPRLPDPFTDLNIQPGEAATIPYFRGLAVGASAYAAFRLAPLVPSSTPTLGTGSISTYPG